MTSSVIQKLYSVTMEVTAVVLATSEREAETNFRYHQGDILLDHADVCCDGVIADEDELSDGWDAECLPYGDREERPISYWLDLPPEPVRDTKTIDMFAEVQS